MTFYPTPFKAKFHRIYPGVKSNGLPDLRHVEQQRRKSDALAEKEIRRVSRIDRA